MDGRVVARPINDASSNDEIAFSGRDCIGFSRLNYLSGENYWIILKNDGPDIRPRVLVHTDPWSFFDVGQRSIEWRMEYCSPSIRIFRGDRPGVFQCERDIYLSAVISKDERAFESRRCIGPRPLLVSDCDRFGFRRLSEIMGIGRTTMNFIPLEGGNENESKSENSEIRSKPRYGVCLAQPPKWLLGGFLTFLGALGALGFVLLFGPSRHGLSLKRQNIGFAMVVLASAFLFGTPIIVEIGEAFCG